MRMLGHLESTGEVPKGTVKKWVKHTPGGVKNLPERVKSKKK
jgi:hypothetical protein